MSSVKECDVCGDTYECKGIRRRFSQIKLPYRYKIYRVLPWNREMAGFVKQDLCVECTNNLEDALRLLKGSGENE